MIGRIRRDRCAASWKMQLIALRLMLSDLQDKLTKIVLIKRPMRFGGVTGAVVSKLVQLRSDNLPSSYWDDSSGERIYLFTRHGLREATKGHDFGRVLKALEDAHAFVKRGANEISIATRTPDGRIVRLYYIDPQKLE
jgi:hypothetical protein